MTRYIAYNLVLAILILPASYHLAGPQNRWRNLRIAARVASLMVLIVYPWDFFAIHLNVWRYPTDPSPTLYDVPINDLVFSWLCSHLSATVLLAVRKWQAGS